MVVRSARKRKAEREGESVRGNGFVGDKWFLEVCRETGCSDDESAGRPRQITRRPEFIARKKCPASTNFTET